MSNKLALIAKDFTPEKVDLIKRTVAQGATDDELELFLYQSQRTGLDPLARQIVFSKFNTKNGARVSIITSIDGYRLLADRTGKYAGNDDPIFEGEPNPIKASVTVYKLVSGIRCPFTATARWSEYCPADNKDFMWRKMPHLMLGKCAEALALRKAFPAELSGLYTDTEMEQAGFVEGNYTEEPAKEQPKKAEAPKTNGTSNTNVQLKAETPRPQLVPNKLREILQKKVENSTLRDKVTEEFLPIQYHPFGEKTAQIVASRFQAAFSIGEGLPEKPEAMYKTCLSWLTGHSSAKNISAAWADAILDWLVNGNKADKFKAAIVAPAMAEALAIYEQATQEAKANEMADSIMGDTPWDELEAEGAPMAELEF